MFASVPPQKKLPAGSAVGDLVEFGQSQRKYGPKQHGIYGPPVYLSLAGITRSFIQIRALSLPLCWIIPPEPCTNYFSLCVILRVVQVGRACTQPSGRPRGACPYCCTVTCMQTQVWWTWASGHLCTWRRCWKRWPGPSWITPPSIRQSCYLNFKLLGYVSPM